MKNYRLLPLALILLAAVACRHIKIHSGAEPYSSYDVHSHRSKYADPPLSDLIIPGKWWRLRSAQGAESKEPVFYNEDSIFIWLDRYPRQQFDFNRQVRTGSEFLQRYWTAVSNNWERRDLQAELLTKNMEQNYIICKTQPEEPCCTMHLIGYRQEMAYHFSIKGDLDDAEKVNLLESLFILN